MEQVAILVAVVVALLQLVEAAHLLMAALAAMGHLLPLVEVLLPMRAVVVVEHTQELAEMEAQVAVERAEKHLRQQHRLHLEWQTPVVVVAVVKATKTMVLLAALV